jgi:hypothetical protein
MSKIPREFKNQITRLQYSNYQKQLIKDLKTRLMGLFKNKNKNRRLLVLWQRNQMVLEFKKDLKET